MSRKDYIAAAKLITTNRGNMSAQAINNVIDTLCTLFRDDNHRFDRAKFVVACGGYAAIVDGGE